MCRDNNARFRYQDDNVKKLILHAAMLLAVLVTVPVASAQQTRYISDSLAITLRSGAGNQYRILKSLDSGTPVTVLQTDEENGWSQVQASDGTEGWVLTRFLMDQPSARAQLRQAQATIQHLTDNSQPLRKQVLELEQSKQALQARVDKLTASNSGLSKQLQHVKEISSNAITTDQQNKKLMENNQMLQNRLGVLKAENERLKDDSNKEWFMNGALAVIFGVILTLVIPRLVPRKKRSDWA